MAVDEEFAAVALVAENRLEALFLHLMVLQSIVVVGVFEAPCT